MHPVSCKKSCTYECPASGPRSGSKVRKCQPITGPSAGARTFARVGPTDIERSSPTPPRSLSVGARQRLCMDAARALQSPLPPPPSWTPPPFPLPLPRGTTLVLLLAAVCGGASTSTAPWDSSRRSVPSALDTTARPRALCGSPWAEAAPRGQTIATLTAAKSESSTKRLGPRSTLLLLPPLASVRSAAAGSARTEPSGGKVVASTPSDVRGGGSGGTGSDAQASTCPSDAQARSAHGCGGTRLATAAGAWARATSSQTMGADVVTDEGAGRHGDGVSGRKWALPCGTQQSANAPLAATRGKKAPRTVPAARAPPTFAKQ